MWNTGTTTAGTANYYGHPPPQQPPAGFPGLPAQPPPSTASAQAIQAANSGQKHDIFVGNLAFTTTEEQLYSAFSELGRIIKVRMVSDIETGKPRGFAFIEFEDPQAALSAIRNMNEYEINGRKIRVNFSNSSHLETLANQLGMDLGTKDEPKKEAATTSAGGSGATASSGVAGSKAVASALKSMNKGELYDVVAKLKEIADSNPDEARKLLTQHPQLPEAILYCMSELDMIKNPVATAPGLPPPGPSAIPSDPRAAAVPPPAVPPPTMAMPSDPRARAIDPRAVTRDPRAAAAPNFPPPPNFAAPPAMPPPPTMQQPPPQQAAAPSSNVAGLDPNLVQQVMALTPQQIQLLPPDKQQSILALRQQITGGR